MPQIEEIPLDKIIYDSDKLPDKFNRNKWKEIARSLSAIKVVEVIIVEENEDGYLLLTGKDRYQALKNNNIEKSSAVVVEDHVITKKEMNLFNNFQPEDIDPLERALIIKNYIDENGLTKKKASKKLDIPRTTLNTWLIILDFPEKYQKKVVDNHYGKNSFLTLHHLERAKRIKSRTNNSKLTKEFLEACLEFDLNTREGDKLHNLIKRNTDVDILNAAKVIKKRYELKKQTDGIIYGNVDDYIKEINNDFKKIKDKLKNINIDNKNDYEKKVLTNEFKLMYQLLDEICLEVLGESIE